MYLGVIVMIIIIIIIIILKLPIIVSFTYIDTCDLFSYFVNAV